MKKHKITIITLILTLIITLSLLTCCNRKQDINKATIQQLDTVEDIGEVLSKEIYVYVQANNIATVSELDGKIKYLGDTRLKELKKKYK